MTKNTKTDIDTLWIIYYFDNALPSDLFSGEGAEMAARASFDLVKDNYNCVLMKEVVRG